MRRGRLGGDELRARSEGTSFAGDPAGMNAEVLQDCRPAFLQACGRLHDLFDGPDTFDARFAIGSLVAAVKADPDTYGAGAVARRAPLLDQDLSRLYRYAIVTECWTEAEARRLLTPPLAGAGPLTWSHLVTLASLARPRERAFWTKFTCVESLSVRGLASRITRRKPTRGSDRHLERDVRAVERFLAAHEPEHVLPADAICCRATLARAVAVHERLRALASRRVEAFRRRLADVDERSPLSETESSPGPAPRQSSATLIMDGHRYDSEGRRPGETANNNRGVRARRKRRSLKTQILAGHGARRA